MLPDPSPASSSPASSIATPAWIDSARDLTTLCAALADAPWLALDTEFHRVDTYYPKLCLLQVATPALAACIDPLADINLAPLLDILYDPARVKVLHSARQDFEILFGLRGAVPANLFDTQLAATRLGLSAQQSYAALVQARLGVTLEKLHTRTDWRLRPLAEACITYALDDVRHLAALYPALALEIDARGLGAALAQDHARLLDPATYAPPPESAWNRINGTRYLQGTELAGAKVLAAWREREARRLDRPRQWILSDAALLTLARCQPESMAALATIAQIPPRTRTRHGAHWLDLLARARAGQAEREPAAAPSTTQPDRSTTGPTEPAHSAIPPEAPEQPPEQ